MLSLLVSVHLPTMMMASIVLFEMFGRGGGEPRASAAHHPQISARLFMSIR